MTYFFLWLKKKFKRMRSGLRDAKKYCSWGFIIGGGFYIFSPWKSVSWWKLCIQTKKGNNIANHNERIPVCIPSWFLSLSKSKWSDFQGRYFNKLPQSLTSLWGFMKRPVLSIIEFHPPGPIGLTEDYRNHPIHIFLYIVGKYKPHHE